MFAACKEGIHGRYMNLFLWLGPPDVLEPVLMVFCDSLQIPDWSKCTSRKDRKEKKVEKPFYSDSEGESGPTESADSGNCGERYILSSSY